MFWVGSRLAFCFSDSPAVSPGCRGRACGDLDGAASGVRWQTPSRWAARVPCGHRSLSALVLNVASSSRLLTLGAVDLLFLWEGKERCQHPRTDPIVSCLPLCSARVHAASLCL